MQTILETSLTAAQTQAAIDDLMETRATFLNQIRDLSEEQWRFKPAPAAWSIQEIAEHITMVEARIAPNVHGLLEAPLAEAGRKDDEIDQFVRSSVRDRTFRALAPDPLLPSGTWTAAECISRFEELRQANIAMLDEPLCFRGRVRPHPLLGAWDGYQWILAGSAHCARHTAQIEEVKSNPSFPKA